MTPEQVKELIALLSSGGTFVVTRDDIGRINITKMRP